MKTREAMEVGVNCSCDVLYPLTVSQILTCSLVPDSRIWSSEGICTLKFPELVPASLWSSLGVYRYTNGEPEQQVGTGLALLSYLLTGAGSYNLRTSISQPLHRPSPGEVWFWFFLITAQKALWYSSSFTMLELSAGIPSPSPLHNTTVGWLEQ